MGAVGALCLVLSTLLLSPLSARSLALEPGVHGEPGSPAGKEYGFPLGGARNIGGHNGTFGAGITRNGTGSADATGPNSTLSGSGRASTAVPARAAGAPGGPANAAAAGSSSAARSADLKPGTRLPSTANTGLVAAWTLAAVAGVLVVGALGAWAVIRRSRRPSAGAD